MIVNRPGGEPGPQRRIDAGDFGKFGILRSGQSFPTGYEEASRNNLMFAEQTPGSRILR